MVGEVFSSVAKSLVLAEFAHILVDVFDPLGSLKRIFNLVRGRVDVVLREQR